MSPTAASWVGPVPFPAAGGSGARRPGAADGWGSGAGADGTGRGSGAGAADGRDSGAGGRGSGAEDRGYGAEGRGSGAGAAGSAGRGAGAGVAEGWGSGAGAAGPAGRGAGAGAAEGWDSGAGGLEATGRSFAGSREDADLAGALAAAVAGDEAGFAVLWRTLQPALLRYLRVVVGDAAEDVASETWLQAARDLAGFTGGPAVFRVWLFRIARHRGIDAGRRAWRRREEPREAVERDDALVRDVAFDVLERAETDWALRLIGTLPRDQAEAVMLRVVAGLDVAATAEVLGKRPGAVRVATMRGLRRLGDHPEIRTRGRGE